MKIVRWLVCIMIAMVASSQAVVTNTVQFGGDANVRDLAWNDGTWNTNTPPYELSVNYTPPSNLYPELSNVVITVSAVETNGNNALVYSTTWIGSSNGAHAQRLDGNDALKVTVSYADPDNVLLGLKVDSFGAWYNGGSEVTTFSVGANTYSNAQDQVQIDYDTTGLDQLTLANTGTWSMVVAAGTLATESAFGGFALQYIGDSEYIAPPVTNTPPWGEVVFSGSWYSGNTVDSLDQTESSWSGVSKDDGLVQDRRIYRAAANSRMPYVDFKTNEVLTISFTASITTNAPLEGADRMFRFSAWNSDGVATETGFSTRMDYGVIGGTTFQMGIGNPSTGNIGDINTGFYTSSTDVPTNPLEFQGDSSDIKMIITRTGETSYDYVAYYDDVVLSNSYANVDFGVFSAIGFSLESSPAATNSFSITNLLAVVTDPTFDFNYYGTWASGNGLTNGVNDAYGNDPDEDGMDNLLEYAVGANPLVDDAAAFRAQVELLLDSGELRYVYRRRTDAEARKLTYTVGAGTDLVYSPLTNATVEVGTASIDADFERVTNRVSTAIEDKQFMKLWVEAN